MSRILLIAGAVAVAVYVSRQDISATQAIISYAVLAFVAATNLAVIIFPGAPSLTFSLGIPLLLAGMSAWMWRAGPSPDVLEWATIGGLAYMALLFALMTASNEVSKRRELPLLLLYAEVFVLAGAVIILAAALTFVALVALGVLSAPAA